MIVIKATGSTDVKSLRKLASALSAEEAELSAAEIQAATRKSKRSGNPTVSTLPGASISPQARDAILKLQPVHVERDGDYELS